MTLSEKQRHFVRLLGRLLAELHALGFEATVGDAYRSPEEADRLAALGKGIVNSLHTRRLAIDLNLFRDGEYVTQTMALEPLGRFWEGLHPDTRWGGRFGDGNHFSLTHEGIK